MTVSDGETGAVFHNGACDLQIRPMHTGEGPEASGQGLHRVSYPSRGLEHADYVQPIAKNALTILINISGDQDVLESLAKDDAFLDTLLLRITVCQWHLALPP